MADDTRNSTVAQESTEPRIPAALLARIRGEYREMPGLCLTASQAARLWGMAPDLCADVLRALVHEGALIRTRDIHYVAADTARAPRRRAPGAWPQRRGTA
jgi:hypothetical protein